MTDQATDLEAQKIWEDLDKREADGTLHAQVDPPKQEDGQPPADKTTEQEAPADKADAESTEQPPADGQEPPANIWADAKPEQRAAFEALRKQHDDIASQNKRIAGTVAGYQRRYEEVKQELAKVKAPAKPAEAEASTDTDSGIFDDPEIKKAAEEYPEVIGPLKKAFTALEQRAAKLEKELGGISQDRRDANLQEQALVVYEAHSDYDQIAQSPQFLDWYKSAPAYIKAGIERNATAIVDGAEVSHIVKLYKAETGVSQTKPPAQGNSQPNGQSERRKHQLEGASTPAPKGPAKVTTGVPDDPEQAWKFFEELDRKKAQNR